MLSLGNKSVIEKNKTKNNASIQLILYVSFEMISTNTISNTSMKVNTVLDASANNNKKKLFFDILMFI